MGEVVRSYTAGQLVAATALLVVPFALAVYAMWRGYRRRTTVDETRFGPLPAVQEPGRPPDGEALYTGTTRGGSRMQQVAVSGLFGRGVCRYWIEPPQGLVFRRERGPAVAVSGVREVGLTGAHAGRVLSPGRIAVVAWTLGDEPVDTGFGFEDAARAATFAAAVANASGLPAEEHDDGA
jgi:hypothetical protein